MDAVILGATTPDTFRRIDLAFIMQGVSAEFPTCQRKFPAITANCFLELEQGTMCTVLMATEKNAKTRLTASIPTDLFSQFDARTCRELRVYWRGRKPSDAAFVAHDRTAQWLEMDLKGAGLNPHARGQVVDFHSLRHTYATRAGRETATFADLMELLGHRTPAMTARYAHAEKDRLKQVAERLAQ
jgi:site-specific recombinase XerD